jgi:hypothetical protein
LFFFDGKIIVSVPIVKSLFNGFFDVCLLIFGDSASLPGQRAPDIPLQAGRDVGANSDNNINQNY